MKLDTKKLVAAAIIAALYAVLTMLLSPISYGPVQLRLSEVLCILPYFLPFSAFGLFFGCLIANIVSAAGVLDMIFGSLATLAAGLCTAAIGGKVKGLRGKIFACSMPVIWNAVVVGAVLTLALSDVSPLKAPGVFAVYAAQVGLSELAVMLAVGLPLMIYLPKHGFFREIILRYT